jgi:ankyrin repeat protein
MDNFDEQLKDAIVCNDVDFLEKHINQHNIDYRFGDEDNDTLLLYAISDKGSEAYKFFLDKGANQYLKTKKGNYPLALAINDDHEDVAKYLFNLFYS